MLPFNELPMEDWSFDLLFKQPLTVDTAAGIILTLRNIFNKHYKMPALSQPALNGG